VAFAQVREDPLIDLWVARQIGAGANILMVASGGCTAALLAAQAEARRIHLVDPNPAQLALARLKLFWLRTASTEERLALLGHRSWTARKGSRRQRLGAALDELGLPPDVFGPLEWVAEVGPDQAGRYERLFVELRRRLEPVRDELDALLDMDDPSEQIQRAAANTKLGQAIDHALLDVMALSNLIALFGEGATRNRVEPFARHFSQRTRQALTLPARTNPFLWQMYRGVYPDSVPADWFVAAAPTRLPHLSWSIRPMTEALAQAPEPIDMVHLSNILDWLAPEEGRRLLELAAAALKPGGWVVIRQLNSTLDVAGLGTSFAWQAEQARSFNDSDRSFFYRALHLGRKR
jgi:S-adenosylmethionine-diacylglycerol 3-amino-3-carboxypropyl transferase